MALVGYFLVKMLQWIMLRVRGSTKFNTEKDLNSRVSFSTLFVNERLPFLQAFQCRGCDGFWKNVLFETFTDIFDKKSNSILKGFFLKFSKYFNFNKREKLSISKF